MNGQPILYVDQWGNRWRVRTVRELHKRIGGGRLSKMFRDKADGDTVHCGYVVGQHWCTAYRPIELPA